jgi:hypothetical protein
MRLLEFLKAFVNAVMCGLIVQEAAELAKDAQTLTDQEWDQKYDPGARRSGI